VNLHFFPSPTLQISLFSLDNDDIKNATLYILDPKQQKKIVCIDDNNKEYKI
jgi:hypothetical protein